jgi:hypothetical protein
VSAPIRALRNAVVPPHGTGRIAGSAFADAIGTGVFSSGAAIYFSHHLGLSTAVIGGGLAIAGGVALAAVAPLGRLSDRFGYQRFLRIAHLGRAALYPLYPLVGNVAEFAALITVITVLDRIAAPAFQAMVGTAVGGERRSETMGYLRALRNAGFSVGGLLTSAAIAVGTSTAYDLLPVGNAASFAVAGILLPALGNARAPRASSDGAPARRRIRPRYLVLSALNVVLLMHDTILQLALPLYVVTRTHIPATVLPPMFVLNTVLVVLGQRRLSRWTSGVSGAARAEQLAGLLLAASCGCFAAITALSTTGAVIVLVTGVIALTVAESLQVAGSWELSHERAPADERGAYLAVFSIGVGLQQSIGPAIVSLLSVCGAIAWLPFAVTIALAGTATRRIAVPWPSREPESRQALPGTAPPAR